MPDQDEHPDLAEFLAGDGAADQVLAAQAHVDGCAECRGEIAEIREMERMLRDVPAEAAVDGRPEGGDVLLARTLREIRLHDQAQHASGGRRPALLLVAAAGVALALVGGVLIGRGSAPGPSTIAAPPPSMPAEAPVPGTRYLDVADARTGARVEAHIVPMAGWVRVHAAVAGIPAGQYCRLVVIGTGGQREVAGSWVVSPQGAKDGTTLMGAAAVNPTQVQALVVENSAGQQFVAASV